MRNETFSASESPSSERLSQRTERGSHVVFLVPGLLGFERFSTFSYFADRVSAALRAGLEQAWDAPVPVIPVPIPPTASLYDRQRRLVKTLADRMDALSDTGNGDASALQIHLVGHSTGGVDANLLTSRVPLPPRGLIGRGNTDAEDWAQVDRRAPNILKRIRTVVSIASPHQGACITQDPVARLVSQRDVRGTLDLLVLLGKFAWGTMCDVDLGTFATSAVRESGKTARFLRDVFDQWELLEDLHPSRSAQPVDARSDVVRRTFVTIAATPSDDETHTPSANAFFLDLSRRASGRHTGCTDEGAAVSAAVSRLRLALADAELRGSDARVPVIKSRGAKWPHDLDAGHSDGVVNTARQLIDPANSDELAGIIVGDHFDVLGYYDRRVWRTDDSGRERAARVLAGLLHSGSMFGDDQFFALYRQVADVIAAAAASSRAEPPPDHAGRKRPALSTTA